MTKQSKALQMAINALTNCSKFEEAIQACKEALEQPKEPRYLYAYRMAGQHNVEFRFWDTKTDAPTYVGKIKLENDDDM